MYYNTTNEQGNTLKKSHKKSMKQQDMALAVFQKHPNVKMTPVDIANGVRHYFGKKYPITSIRRCISDLTKDGRIEKTATKREGMYGKMNYTWKLKI